MHTLVGGTGWWWEINLNYADWHNCLYLLASQRVTLLRQALAKIASINTERLDPHTTSVPSVVLPVWSVLSR